MRARIKRNLIVVVLTLLMAGLTIPSISDAQDTAPIKGAKVFLEGPGSGFVTTDDNGKFVIAEGLETGTYSIRVTAWGYIDSKLEGIEVTAGRETPNVDFFLKHSGAISGVIDYIPISVLGCPCCSPSLLVIPEVSATQTEGPGGNLSSVAVCSADDGSYMINTGLSTGKYKVTAEFYGYITSTLDNIEVKEGQETLDVNTLLVPGGVMSGMVMTSDGMPLFRALVTAHSSVYSGFAYTNSSGHFKIVNGLGGNNNNVYNVFAQYKTYSGSRSNIEVHQLFETSGINFRLDVPPSGSIVGRLTDDKGKVVRNAVVRATGSAGQVEARTDEDGYYSILLGAGEYTVSTSAAGFYPSSPIPATVSINQQKSINLELRQVSGSDSGRITGQVTGKINPIPEFQVSFLPIVYVVTALMVLLTSLKIRSIHTRKGLKR